MAHWRYARKMIIMHRNKVLTWFWAKLWVSVTWNGDFVDFYGDDCMHEILAFWGDPTPLWVTFESGASQTKCGFEVLQLYHIEAPWVCFFCFFLWVVPKWCIQHARNSGVLRSNAHLHWLCQQSYTHQTKLGTTSHHHVYSTFWTLCMADWLHIYLMLMWVISSTSLARSSPEND